MKRILSLVLFICFFKLNFAQDAAGIRFIEHTPWKEVLARAKTENKLIFVDVYTDWCGPCKVMDNEVFNKKAVGDQYNSSFINYKLDAEKGEGPALAKKYLVKSYPNYLFINGEGTLIYRSTSSMPVKEFLDVAKNALAEAKEGQTIVQLDLLYPDKKTDKTFMYTYLHRRTQLRLDNADLLDEYINLLSDTERSELKNLQLILDNGMFLSKNLQLGISLETLKKNSDKLPLLKQRYKEGIDGIIQTAIETTLRKAIVKKDEKLLAEVIALKKPAKGLAFDNKETARLTYFMGTGQFEMYSGLAKDYVNNFLLKISLDTLAKHDAALYQRQLIYLQNDKNFKGDIQEEAEQYKHAITIQLTNAIHSISKNLVQVTTKPADLKMAAKWLIYSEEITDRDTAYFQNVIPFYTENQALLLYKSGNKSLAIAKMENMLAKMNNPKITAHFTPLINRMKANENL